MDSNLFTYMHFQVNEVPVVIPFFTKEDTLPLTTFPLTLYAHPEDRSFCNWLERGAVLVDLKETCPALILDKTCTSRNSGMEKVKPFPHERF